MKPTDMLIQEHKVIEQVLACLERVVEPVETQGSPLDADAVRDAVDFFHTFVDQCHHGKEEDHLFPALEAKGYSPDTGLTAAMRIHHEQSRTYVRGIEDSITAAAAGEARGLELFIKYTRSCIELLRKHSEKEDHSLYPAVDEKLTDCEQEELFDKLLRMQNDEIGAEAYEKCLAIADSLAERYDVPKVTTEKTEQATRCCEN